MSQDTQKLPDLTEETKIDPNLYLPSKLPEKHQAVALLFQDGVSVKTIAKTFKITTRQVNRILQKVRISPLIEPTIVKEATRTIRNHAKGLPARKDQSLPKDTVVQRAAEYIHDTAFPPKTVHEHTGVVITPVVDLTAYLQGKQPQVEGNE